MLTVSICGDLKNHNEIISIAVWCKQYIFYYIFSVYSSTFTYLFKWKKLQKVFFFNFIFYIFRLEVKAFPGLKIETNVDKYSNLKQFGMGFKRSAIWIWKIMFPKSQGIIKRYNTLIKNVNYICICIRYRYPLR